MKPVIILIIVLFLCSLLSASRMQQFKSLCHDPLLLEIEQILRAINEWNNPQAQKYFRLAKLGTRETRNRALQWFENLLNTYQQLSISLDDPFMPLATQDQISNNRRGIHILDQAHNNYPYFINPQNDFVITGLLIGPPRSGKTSAAFNLAQQMPIPKLFLDFKSSWNEQKARQLNAQIIPPEFLSIDFDKPNNSKVSLEQWIYSCMENLAYVTGLQYGLDPLLEAAQLALIQKQEHEDKTNTQTILCLKDIAMCLPLTGFKNKRADYSASAQTALNLILGPNENNQPNILFATRQGLPLSELFQGNYILPCYHLNIWQARYLGFLLFNYLRYANYGEPENTSTTGLIIIDDASKVVSRPDSIFGASSRHSPWQHLLKEIQSTGWGWMFMEQTGNIAEDIKALANFWLIVGCISDGEMQKNLASILNLTEQQTQYLAKMKTQEAICYCPLYYPKPVHGRIPNVSQR